MFLDAFSTTTFATHALRLARPRRRFQPPPQLSLRQSTAAFSSPKVPALMQLQNASGFRPASLVSIALLSIVPPLLLCRQLTAQLSLIRLHAIILASGK